MLSGNSKNTIQIMDFNINNLTLNYRTDTLFVYPQRQYNCNRKYYYYTGGYNKIITKKNYGIYDRFNQLIIDMGDSPFRGAYFNHYAIFDSIAMINRFIIMDTSIIQLNEDDYFDFLNIKKYNSLDSIDSVCSKLAKSIFKSSWRNFAISDNLEYFGITQKPNDSLSYIIFNREITDSISNNFIIKKSNKKYFESLSKDDFWVDKDTIYFVWINDRDLDINSEIFDSFYLYSINNGKKNIISDSSEVVKYLSKLKLPILNLYGYIDSRSLVIIAKIDNTIILYYTPSEQYIFYDYINKKFFDPVIKVIND